MVICSTASLRMFPIVNRSGCTALFPFILLLEARCLCLTEDRKTGLPATLHWPNTRELPLACWEKQEGEEKEKQKKQRRKGGVEIRCEIFFAAVRIELKTTGCREIWKLLYKVQACDKSQSFQNRKNVIIFYRVIVLLVRFLKECVSCFFFSSSTEHRTVQCCLSITCCCKLLVSWLKSGYCVSLILTKSC